MQVMNYCTRSYLNHWRNNQHTRTCLLLLITDHNHSLEHSLKLSLDLVNQEHNITVSLEYIHNLSLEQDKSLSQAQNHLMTEDTAEVLIHSRYNYYNYNYYNLTYMYTIHSSFTHVQFLSESTVQILPSGNVVMSVQPAGQSQPTSNSSHRTSRVSLGYGMTIMLVTQDSSQIYCTCTVKSAIMDTLN